MFAAAVRARRRWYERHPEARRRLSRPVVSVGNLAMGGTGKTPTVACLARRMLAWGERPAILSRGYGRATPRDGVVVVRDPERVLGTLAESGDEPLMLARSLDGVSVLVSPDRYLAGRLAEQHLGATVHILDDGFQHLALERDVDLLLVTEEDRRDGRTLPFGRLREPLDASAAADALIAVWPAFPEHAPGGQGPPDRPTGGLGPPDKTTWRLVPCAARVEPTAEPALVVAGIARPARLTSSAREAGWTVVDALVFPDHHSYSRRDVERILARARETGARIILTSPKDHVRLEPVFSQPEGLGLPVVVLSHDVSIEPADEFDAWLRERLAEARR
jgi:tetraacyldisaccharide 4'-kinase